MLNTTTAGIFDLDTDSNGRWSVEKFKGLMFQIERDCNDIGIRTRRGKGNLVVCSADVASALSMAGVLDVGGSGGSGNLNVDPSPSGSTFAGTINGRIKVYVDPYNSVVSASAASHWYVAGYRGTSSLRLLVCSTVLTFRCKWFVRLVRILSNLKLVSRLVTEWLLIHSLKSVQLVLLMQLHTVYC